MTATNRTLLLGATGTIGQATAAALLADGHEVICPVRTDTLALTGATPVLGDIADQDWLSRQMKDVNGVISCLASRTGAPKDAWRVDHDLTVGAIRAAEQVGVSRFVLLSAICVQKPHLAFQEAKRAAEAALWDSTLAGSVVRPTAFFKSLSGQIGRVQAGKPWLLFGDGQRTACKPISDRDLSRYLVETLADPARIGETLPIGGPGPALTPRDMAEEAFRLTGQPPKYRSVPVSLFDAIITGLRLGGLASRRLAAKAELAKIGRYYATESMLVWDAEAERYDAGATPSFGFDHLFEHYADVVAGRATDDRGDHAVF